jgi:hypothetical protein
LTLPPPSPPPHPRPGRGQAEGDLKVFPLRAVSVFRLAEEPSSRAGSPVSRKEDPMQKLRFTLLFLLGVLLLLLTIWLEAQFCATTACP